MMVVIHLRKFLQVMVIQVNTRICLILILRRSFLRRKYTNLGTTTILIVISHVIAFMVLFVIWLPLCCCCVWPQKHPACRKCRKPQKQLYSKCQLKWTAYVTTFLYLIVLAGATLAISEGYKIVWHFNDVGCKFAAVNDDIINGRMSQTDEGRFFVGLSPLKDELTTYQGQLTTTFTEINNCFSNAANIRLNQNAFKVSIEAVYTAYNNEVYTGAFSSDGTVSGYTDVTSVFKTLHYGPTTANSTILGSIYSTSDNIFNEINAALDPMISAYDNLTTTTQAGVDTQISTTLSSIDTQTSYYEDVLTNVISPNFKKEETFDGYIMIINVIYGMFFALALLGTLCSIILTCCSVVKIRLIMYFTCAFMMFLAFITFFSLIILAVVAPNLSQICGYIDTKLQTGEGTQYLFTQLGYSQTGDFLKNCMADGNGWVVDEVQPTFNESFYELRVISDGVQNLSNQIPSYSTANLMNPFTLGSALVTKISDSQILEVNDTVSTSFIQGVRGLTYPIDIACDTTNVNADSFMPSYDLYSCPSGKSQNNPCLTLSSTLICPLGCYQILTEFTSSGGDGAYSTTLATRYGSNTCNYYLFIKNLHQQWNIPRIANMATVQTSLTSLRTSMTTYDDDFKTVQASISNYQSLLESNFDSTDNLTSGSLNGLDCRVIGESVISLKNAVCVGFLNSIYYNLIILILLSYGTLLIGCFATCAGVRHFKHLQKMQVHVGYKAMPIAISDNRIDDK